MSHWIATLHTGLLPEPAIAELVRGYGDAVEVLL